nr:MAG TPA: hypothetical protein [Caudoviricetes sp.]
MIDKSAQKRLVNPAMIKYRETPKRRKNGEKSKSITVFPGK